MGASGPLTVALPGDANNSKHLHREPGGVGHPAVLLHDALHPAGHPHQLLGPRTEYGETWSRNFGAWDRTWCEV